MSQLKEGIIFPTNFYTSDIFNKYQNQKYKNFLTELSKRTEGKRRSNRNGWQSDTFLWKEDIFKPLLDEALSATQMIAKRLSNKELQKCHYHLIIPANDEYSSLNLSHALQIVSFELMKIVTTENKFMPDEKEFVTSEENEKLISHLMEVLKKIDFYDPKSSKQVRVRIERLIKKSRLDKLEMGILRGFLSKIMDFEK